MLGQDNMRSYTINFPVHAVVQSLEIGLKPGSLIDRPKPYRDIEPVTFYGSSNIYWKKIDLYTGTWDITRKCSMMKMFFSFSVDTNKIYCYIYQKK